MLRTPTTLTACAVAVALAGAGVALAQGGPAATTTQDLTFKNPTVHNTFVDTGKRGESTGDYVVDTGALQDASGGAVGTIIDSCLLAKVGKLDGYSCRGGLELPAGRIAISLVGTKDEKISTFAIDGGSGAYATARGTVVTTPLSKKDGGPSRIEVHIVG